MFCLFISNQLNARKVRAYIPGESIHHDLVLGMGRFQYNWCLNHDILVDSGKTISKDKHKRAQQTVHQDQ